MSEFTCEDCAAFGKLRCICEEIERAENPETRYYTFEVRRSDYDGHNFIESVDVTDYVRELERKAKLYDYMGGDRASDWW